jgi:predicted Fe-Mo cluster-binding NifX family protein
LKICVTASGNTLDALVDPRFGRAAYLTIVDSESMVFEAIPNAAVGAMGGAGIQAAQSLARKGAEVLITGNVGPNAFRALSAAGIKIAAGAAGTVREVVERYKKGELSKTGGPTVNEHFGKSVRIGSGQALNDLNRRA